MNTLDLFAEPTHYVPEEVPEDERFDPATFTYGHELEMGDVPRDLHPPAEWGAWEYSETCSINRREPYALRASDPQGIDPPVGGEINTIPTRGWEAQVDRVMNIIEFYREAGHPPTISCVNDAHIHVRVPGLRDSIAGLKRLVRYIKVNQRVVIDRVHAFEKHPSMTKIKTATSYLKLGGGTPMPEWMADNIEEKAQSFEDVIALHCRGKSGDLSARPNMPLRFAINLYCLKHIDTIEFRIYRATLDRRELESCYAFTEAFLDAALNGGPSAEQILNSREWDFPKLVWEPSLFKAWVDTKWPKSRGKKERRMIEV
jgi:hypothetical protein